MNSNKKENLLDIDYRDFFTSEEYELVSHDDILLMSEEFHSTNNESVNSFYKQILSSVKKYEDEWNELYSNDELDLEKLHKISIEGQLRSSRFRSVYWRCLLGILHTQPKQWICQLKMYRKHYDEISTELEQNPWNMKENNPQDNPLSQESDSIWQKYFSDEELKAVIHQDVKRTFPGMEFFRREDIQSIMVRILFCYARQNPALCYRQGMHEILAPLIFILHCDEQAFLHAKEQILNSNDDISEIFNSDYLEQDAYSIFKYIMNHIECSYRLNNLLNTSLATLSADTVKYENSTCQNEVLSRLDYIKKNLLQPRDPELSDHLQKLDIPLHLFGIRWLRLLFGREFPLQDLLVLWDFIFSSNFETLNFIVVGMLIAIRQILLNGDYTDCLSNLMRYPSGVDVSFVISYALHMKDPLKYWLPDTSKSFYHSINTKNKSNCDSTSAPSQINKRLKKGLPKSSRWFYEKPNLFAGNSDGFIVSGFVSDDPNLMKAELEQSSRVLNIVRHKLILFHSVLSKNLHQNNCSSEVQGALDGIFELCCLLRSYCKENSCEIETACEAGETKEMKVQNSSTQSSTSQVMKRKPTELSINSEKKCDTLPRIKKGYKSGELKVFKHHIGGAIKGVPMTDPLHLIKNLAQEDSLQSKIQ